MHMVRLYTKKKKENQKQLCPYCHIEFKSIMKHIEKCKENPKNKIYDDYQQTRKDLISKQILKKPFRL